MRSTFARNLLPDEATIQRPTVENVGGEQIVTWSDLATTACRIAPVTGGGETGESGGRVVEETTHIVTLPAGQDAEESDRLVIAESIYEITLVRKRGEWELSRRCEVKEAP